MRSKKETKQFIKTLILCSVIIANKSKQKEWHDSLVERARLIWEKFNKIIWKNVNAVDVIDH